MAKNWSAYEAAKEIYGDNKENIAEIGSRFPLFARKVALTNNVQLLDVLKALPKVTARVVETGLKEMDGEEVDIEDDVEETEAPKKDKASKKTPKSKQPVPEEDDDWEDEDAETSEYDSMTGKELYALCCKRGISSQCKSRSKDALIEMLVKLDNGEIEPAGDKKKADAPKKSTKANKKAQKVEEPDEDDWDDEDEDEDPYAGKTARELFAICKERGIKTKPQQKADVYAKLLKADDAKGEAEDEEDDDEDWDI